MFYDPQLSEYHEDQNIMRASVSGLDGDEENSNLLLLNRLMFAKHICKLTFKFYYAMGICVRDRSKLFENKI